MMIAFVALHHLGYGDIMLPQEAHLDDEGTARAEFVAPELVSYKPCKDGSVYYDAVACYNARGQRDRIFSTEPKWLTPGEWVTISAQDTRL